MEEKKNNSNGCVIVFVIIFCLIIIIPFIMSVKDSKKVTDEEIISFAEEEVKQRLRYPSTAKFQNEEIIGNEDNKYVVSMYSVSEDKNHEEGRVKFIVGIENSNGILSMFNIATNEDTCHIDVAEEFEKLANEKKYDEIYDNLFCSKLKETLSREKFKNYNLNLTYCTVDAKANANTDNYLQYVTVTIKNKITDKQWILTIKNGMIYNFTEA